MDQHDNVRPEPYSSSLDEVFIYLGANGKGLSSREAEDRLIKYGENKLPETPPESIFSVFARQFRNPLIYILICSAIAVLVIGDKTDAIVIFAVLFVNAIIGTIQEGRAQNTLASLRKYVETNATVTRDDAEIIVPDYKIVPGDIIILREGERIPADARLISVHNLRVDESSLTGESTPVHKYVESNENGATILEKHNIIFKGTHITTGGGRAVVLVTGLNTEIGRIAREITVITGEVPLKIGIERLTRVIIFATAIITLTLFLVGVSAGNTPREMFLTVVALSVSVVPEGLPIVLTLVLATGIWRMGKQNALVKKMHAVEALGQVDILAVDKTGTITKNEMVVQEVYVNRKTFKIGGIGYEPHGDIALHGSEVEAIVHPELLLVGKTATLSADARIIHNKKSDQWNISGDPTEAAMLVFAQKLGFHKDILLGEYPVIMEMPFDYKLKYHASLNKDGDTNTLSLSGAPESVLDLCNSVWESGASVPLSPESRQEIDSVLLPMLKNGFRVIALATATGAKSLPTTGEQASATFVGFLAMRDAIRPEVAQTVLRARNAGIKTVMITGDHRISAQSIAGDVGIYNQGDKVLTGGEIENMSDVELVKIIDKVSVFARVTPEHKLRIVRAYQSSGKIISMTGDGVNDAPSLSSANLGVAMGKIGTEVAKEASDIVLLDDNIGSIITAVEEGRSIYKTIKKVILYLFSTSAGEVLTITGAILLGYMVPILPAQIIWLNFVTDGFLDTALAMEPKERGLLFEIKTHGVRSLVDRLMITRIVIMAGTMAIGTLYLFGNHANGDPIKAWTISLTLLAVFQWFNALNCRSHYHSIFQINPFSNLFLVGALAIVIVLQLGALYTSMGQKLLHTVPLSVSEWGSIIFIASSIVVVEEVRKLLYRMSKKNLLKFATIQNNE